MWVCEYKEEGTRDWDWRWEQKWEIEPDSSCSMYLAWIIVRIQRMCVGEWMRFGNMKSFTEADVKGTWTGLCHRALHWERYDSKEAHFHWLLLPWNIVFLHILFVSIHLSSNVINSSITWINVRLEGRLRRKINCHKTNEPSIKSSVKLSNWSNSPKQKQCEELLDQLSEKDWVRSSSSHPKTLPPSLLTESSMSP